MKVVRLTREDEREQIALIITALLTFIGQLVIYPAIVKAFGAAFGGNP